MNPLILTIIIALGTFILAIFSALYLNQQMMKNYMDAKFDALDTRFRALDGTMAAEFKAVKAEIETVRSEVSHLATRVERIERQFDHIFQSTFPKS